MSPEPNPGRRSALFTLSRYLGWGVALVATLALLIFLRNTLIGENAAVYHVDPLSVDRTGASNAVLVAPAGLLDPPPDIIAPAFDATPEQVMDAFHRLALAAPRVEIVAGDRSLLWATFVQRSRVFRFPDYISAIAVALEDGRASIAIYSRSAYGGYDWGVNEARMRDWLQQLREALAPIEAGNRSRGRT